MRKKPLDEEETLKTKNTFYPHNPKPAFNPKKAPKPKETSSKTSPREEYICRFCGHAGHVDEFCFRCKRLERRQREYLKDAYLEDLDFLPRFASRATLS